MGEDVQFLYEDLKTRLFQTTALRRLIEANAYFSAHVESASPQ